MTCRKIVLTGLCVLLMTSFCCSAPAAEVTNADDGLQTLRQTSKAFSEVANKAIPAVVFVKVETTVEVQSPWGPDFGFGSPFDDEFFERFFGDRYRRPQQPEKRKQVGQGSGFIIGKDGYILTNNHVVGDADKITVKLQDGRQFEAKPVGTDPKSDLAVIKIDADDLPVIELGDSDQAQIGEWVVAIGNPFGLTATVTVGVISAKGRSSVGIADYEDFIQTDAAINPGNSGGPLLNLEGKAIGINTAIFSRSGGYMGIGFAIPVNMAKEIKKQLIESGKVTRGQLGVYIKDLEPEMAEFYGLEKAQGVLVDDIIKDSPAEKAGLRQDDIILQMNEKDIESTVSFRNTIALLKPGTEIRLLILRDGEKKTFNVTIGSLDESALAAKGRLSEKLGLEVAELTAELAERFGYELGQGVIVSEVRDGSSAAQAGIKAGMLITSINREKVDTVEQYNALLEKAAKKDKVLVRVRHGRYSQSVVLEFEKAE
ncbi:MAG: DegQ family serine endoprotease [Planctomycetota bacterium]